MVSIQTAKNPPGNGGENQPTRQDSDAIHGYDGDASPAITELGKPDGDAPNKPRRKRRTPAPLAVTVEIEWVTGEHAQEVAYRQWLVIKEVLQWVHDHHQPSSPESRQGQP